MLETTILRTSPRFPYHVALIGDVRINAFALPGGGVYVCAGLIPILGEDYGLWAAVLGHELAHTILHHPHLLYLRSLRHAEQAAMLQAQAEHGYSAALWVLLGLSVGDQLLELKLSREEEHEADRLGVLIMAEAGYHPNFAFAMHRRLLRVTGGDASKFGALFSTHPRWETRDERTMQVYSEALAVHESHWADPERSPGGNPPPVGFINSLRGVTDNQHKCVEIEVGYSIHDARGRQLGVFALFLHKKKFVTAALPEFRTSDGSLIASRTITVSSPHESGLATLKIPTEALGTKERKLAAYVSIVTEVEILDSARVNVTFPKP
jgi:Peptidase family M48